MTRPRREVLIGGAIVLVIALVAAILLLGRSPKVPGPGQGVLGRAAPPAAADGSLQALDDACFSGYRVQPAGRDAAHVQHFALSVRLKSSPGDVTALGAILGQRGCAADLERVVAGLAGKGKLAGENGLTISYVTPSGARLLTP